MKKFLILMLMVIVLVALVFNTVGCGTAAPGGEFTEVKIYAGKFGADSYLWGVGTAEILKKSSTWLRGSAEETLGGTDPVTIAGQDPANSLPASSIMSWGMARAGIAPFEQKYPDYMLMFKAVGCPTAFMSTNPDIKTKEDLIGKDIGMFPVGHSLTIPLEEILKAWGIFDKVNLKYIGPNAIRDALLDGSLEVGCTYAKEGKGVGGFMAAGWISEVVMRKKINVISVDKAACEKASANYGLYFPYGGEAHRARILSNVLVPILSAQKEISAPEVISFLTEKTHVLKIQSGEPGPLAQAIAGLDIAIWDLIARKAGKPLYQLFTDRQVDKVPVYASGINPDKCLETVLEYGKYS